MNSTLQLLLRLQELDLLRQGLELAGAYVEQAGFDFLEESIERVRRQVPGPILSHYDALSRRYPEPVAAVSCNICHACEGKIPARLVSLLDHSNELPHCPHCGRFLCHHEKAPDYVGTK